MANATHKLSARYGNLTGNVITKGEQWTTFQPESGGAPITVETDDVKPITAKPAKNGKAK